MEETPTFEAACARLTRFLADHGWPAKITWTAATDILLLPGGKALVRRRSSSSAAESARAYYEEGRAQGVGVALNVSCQLDDAACASIFWTADDTEAESCFMPEQGLKLTIATPRREARSGGLLRWRFAALSASAVRWRS
jgi:hypothetical protein